MLEGHLHQALDSSPQRSQGGYTPAAAGRQSSTVSFPGSRRLDAEALAAEELDHDFDNPGATSLVNAESGSPSVKLVQSPPEGIGQKPNMRSAMLSFSADLSVLDGDAEGRRGWMRSAMLQFPTAAEGSRQEPVLTECDVNPQDPSAPTLMTPPSGVLDGCTNPAIRLRGAADAHADTSGDHHTGHRFCKHSELEKSVQLGDFRGRAHLTARELVYARSAMLPLSTMPSLEQVQTGLPVLVHIYDVTQEVGIRRLNKVLANKRLPIKFGGVFHAGVEVNGEEWSYGCTESEDDPGVNSNEPRMHPDHHYRQTVAMPCTQLAALQIQDVLEDLSREYPGPAYDILRRNCCHFADDFCRRLGVGSIPSWVYRLARIAARIENFLQAAQRIRTPC